MNDYSGVCYAKTFINQVIIRVDFLQFLAPETVFHLNVEKAILRVFPRRAPDQLIRFNAINVVIDPNKGEPNTNSQVVDGIQREYRSASDKNKVLLSNKYIVFEINEYKAFDNHMQGISSILSALYSINKITAVRVGIRYINLYDSNKIKIQKNYFASSISSTICSLEKDVSSNIALVRSMHLSEYAINSMKLNFRYGMYNPDYPNPLKKNDFALDYDCFSEEPTESIEDVLQYINNGHQAIQNLFENAITDSLRKVMRSE